MDTPEAVAALIAHPTCSLLLAVQDGAVVGSLIAAFDGWRGNMYRLAVREDLRRRGIARALVEEGHAWLRSLGVRRVTALVGDYEEAAVELWRGAGYEHDPVHQRYVRNL